MTAKDPDCRAAIRARLQSRQLPLAHGHRLFRGQGDGALCACCDRFITTSEIQFDVECPEAGGPDGERERTRLSMHLQCFSAWVAESRLLADEAMAGKATQASGSGL